MSIKVSDYVDVVIGPLTPIGDEMSRMLGVLPLPPLTLEQEKDLQTYANYIKAMQTDVMSDHLIDMTTEYLATGRRS